MSVVESFKPREAEVTLNLERGAEDGQSLGTLAERAASRGDRAPASVRCGRPSRRPRKMIVRGEENVMLRGLDKGRSAGEAKWLA